ncbi:hypothetical protein SEA_FRANKENWEENIE_42 [Streptomyces phage Frankenweenie]|nr:hypothetical protein SEA_FRANKENWEENIE_42 [Streptomyces phage Frankenweenie]
MNEDKTTAEEDTISVPLPGVEQEPEPEQVSDAERLEKLAVDLGDVRAAMESVGRALAVLSTEFERLSTLVIGEEDTIVHACPPEGSGLMPCCGRSPIDVPLTERISMDGTAVTCPGVPKALPPS